MVKRHKARKTATKDAQTYSPTRGVIEKGENHRKAVREHYARSNGILVRNAEAIREKRRVQVTAKVHSRRAAAKLRRRYWDPPKKSAQPEVEDDDFIPCRSSAHSVASIGRAGFLSSGSYNSECLAVPTADENVASQALVSLGAQMRITSSCDSVLVGSSVFHFKYRSSVSVQLEPTPSIEQASCYDSVLETARYLSSSPTLPIELGRSEPKEFHPARGKSLVEFGIYPFQGPLSCVVFEAADPSGDHRLSGPAVTRASGPDPCSRAQSGSSMVVTNSGADGSMGDFAAGEE
ncbi:hypothetical protein B0H10DRAFT_1948901 [Mycena sp. CBHHK59/15]|nr:hypothetical protein B0H10DRAFT_1948901 [Mycena sp. CBHHK59/15]